MIRAAATLFVLLVSAAIADDTVTRGNNLAVDVANDGRLLMDLGGDAWLVPLAGGEAIPVTESLGSLTRPRWSPDAAKFVYTANASEREGIWIHDRVAGTSERISRDDTLDIHPAWHPSGERLVYASDRRDSGFDLWETDLLTGLHWRLSSRPGDETEPAWSANGRHLAYIHRDGDTWSLMLRLHGKPDETLVSGSDRLAGPAWRPDGSLITYWRETSTGPALDMVILSEPRLIRRYMEGENYTTAPVSWLDKHRMYYSADGVIRQRLFNAWSSKTVPFRATVEAEPKVVVERVRRSLPRISEPPGTLIIRAQRLFDGIDGSWQQDRDIVIERGQIAAVRDRSHHGDAIVIDMGDLAVLPGFVDVQARLPEDVNAAVGPLILATGVTTVVTSNSQAEHLNTIWSGKDLPGPRALAAPDWPVAAFSGLADSQTPGLETLLGSRQAGLLDATDPVARRFSERPVLDTGVTDIVLGSAPNGLAPGIGVHAELYALEAAGLRPEQALRTAGVNAAAALGVDPMLGRVDTGAVADLVFVDGDPLVNLGDALKVVAIVRNGRFYSVAGLVERAELAETVE
ncbi:MAG: amidohydrolase family protein [Woeseiaceae bacterium]|nr:amidohydrolase family protein [Woeseiaceae bacterium]